MYICRVFFSGGAENLFDSIKSRKIELDGSQNCKWRFYEKNKRKNFNLTKLKYSRENSEFVDLDEGKYIERAARTFFTRRFSAARHLSSNQ